MADPAYASPHFCAICGKALDLETCKVNAEGRAVHSECVASKLTLLNPYLKFSNLELGKRFTAWCSACGHEFIAEPRTGERDDVRILRMRAEFENHKCPDDQFRL